MNKFTNEALFDDFQDNKQEQSIDVKRHCSANTTNTTTDADVNFRVKLSKFPTSTGKINNWYNSNIDFYAVANASGLGELLEYDPSEEVDHFERLDEDEEYDDKVEKLYKILKKVISRGSARTKIQTHEAKKGYVLAYDYMGSYYDLYGDNNINDKMQLIYILSLELHYKPPGGFDKYLSTFEDLCKKLETCDQGLMDT